MRRFLVLLLLIPAFFIAEAKVKLPSSILGNWIQESNNSWEYGIYENFAIVNGIFWDYEHISQNQSQTKIILKNGEKRLPVFITNNPDGSVKIGLFPNGLTRYIQSYNKSPDFKQYEKDGFKEPLIRPGSFELRGYLQGYDLTAENSKYIKVIYFSLLEDEQKVFISKIDSYGRFTIKFPIINPQEVMLEFGEHLIELYAEPGSSLMAYVNINQISKPYSSTYLRYMALRENIKFMGRSAALNNEILDYSPLIYQHFDPSSDGEEISKRGAEDYKKYRLGAMQNQLDNLASYVTEHNTSEKFKQRSENFLKYRAADDLIRYNFLKTNKDSILTAEYLSFTNNIPLNNKKAVITYSYGQFLRSWLLNNFQVNSMSLYNPKFHKVSMAEIVEQARIAGFKFENDEADFLITKPNLLRTGKVLNEIEKKDSIKQYSLQVKYDTALDTGIRRAYNNRHNLIEWEGIKRAQQEFQKGVGVDILIAKKIMRGIDDEVVFNSKTLSLCKSLINNPVIYEEVRKYNSNMKAKLEGRMPEGANLLSSVYTNAGEVLEKLSSAYKGKVIYVDFWAPWCVPCMGEMPNSQRLQAELKNSNVVFLYLGVQCTKESWQKTIKASNLKGEHYLLTKDQYSLLSCIIWRS